MNKSTYVYASFIRTTPKKLWQALISPDFQKQYFMGASFDTDWKKASAWTLGFGDGTIADSGKVLEVKLHKRIVLSWRHEMDAKIKAEGFARCTIEVKPINDVVKLTITHEMNRPNSKLIKAISRGWPFIISNLKSMLESGKVIMKDWAE
jgi:uncharacterized protein YndB with AHSA1/START domain